MTKITTQKIFFTAPFLVAITIILAAGSAMSQALIHRSDVGGTDFYLVFPRAPWGSQLVGAMFNSPVKQVISVTPARDSAHHIYLKSGDTSVYSTGFYNIEYIPEVVRKNKIVHITSEYPMTVHGQYGQNAISGTFTALPVSSWGQEYYVIDIEEGFSDDYTLYPSVYSVPTVTIIAAHPETGVTIIPKATTAKGHSVDTAYTISMDSGSVYTLSTAGDPNAIPHNADNCNADLSGTHIYATKPIGVIIAQSHNTLNTCGVGECGDYAVEWLPPISNWDTMYVIPPSVPRLFDVGEQVRFVTAVDATTIYLTDNTGVDHLLGVFNFAGSPEKILHLSYPAPFILHANNPFLPIEITPEPQNCVTDQGGDGGEPWTLSFNVPTGVHNWSDRLSFSAPYTAAASLANIYFKESDKANLSINGVPFITAFPKSIQLAGGYSYVLDSSLKSATYYEIRGINGAKAAGTVYGHGSSAFAPGGNAGNEKPMSPLVVKSFAHPIGINGIQWNSSDNIAPRDSVTYGCGHWNVYTFDDSRDPLATGLASITILQEDAPDSSFNVKFSPAPKFGYGDGSATFGIDVINLAQDAIAALRVRDLAGNEFDTILVFNPQIIDALPSIVSAGSIRAGDSTIRNMTLKNSSAISVTFNNARLRIGTRWKMLPPSPNPPFAISAGDSVIFKFQYNASTSLGQECDNDTLMLTTCKEFPVASLAGCNKRPAVFATGFDFGELTIDTLGKTAQEKATNITVANIGSDTLKITAISFKGITMTVPDSDFTVVANITPANPTRVAPGDTIRIPVSAHPHHTGFRSAYVAFETDANHIVNDTAYLTVFGVIPTVGVHDVATGPVEATMAVNYPNPFSVASTIVFTASPLRKYMIYMYDNLGARVAIIPAESSTAGQFHATWSAENFRTGVYHYSIVDAVSGRRVSNATGHVVVVK